jgi:hypothetical protein
MMAEELQGQAGYEDLVAQLDRIWERCVVLAHAGVDAVPLQIVVGGGVSIRCLDDWTANAVMNLDSPGPTTPQR